MAFIVGVLVFGGLQASTVIPTQGQTPEQIQADTSACQAQAASTATTAAPPPQGGRVRGAAAGAVAAEVRGNQYDAFDRVDDDIKQDYRRNRAREAAAAGAVVGASRQRQERREQAAEQQSQPQNNQAFESCISARGYTVQP